MFINFFKLILLITFLHSQAHIISPEDDIKLNYTHILFSWVGDNQVSPYRIQISLSNMFVSNIVDTETDKNYYIDKSNLNWNNKYFWRVKSYDLSKNEEIWSQVYSFEIGDSSESFTNDNDPIQVINHKPNLTSNGLVFFGSYINQYSAAIDVNGDEVWNSGFPNSFVYFNFSQDGELLGGLIDDSYQYNSGMYGSSIDFDLNTIFIENIISESVYNDDFIQHEIIKLPNGNYLTIAPDFRNLPVSQKDGNGSWSWESQFSASELTSFPWMGDRIIEWDSSTNDTLWSISTFDIYSIDDFDILGGTWQTAGSTLPVFDWTHLNAIEYNEAQNAIYISSRHLSKITKIDYSSKQVVWTMGFNQASLFLIENNFSDFYPTYDDGSNASFSFQHGLQVLDNGNIITLDNGNLSNITWNNEQNNKSRVIEISIDEEDLKANIVWEYILPNNLYGRLSGNAQKLYNGNYFVTVIADGATSLEISPTKEIVWECKYNLEALEGPIYRAHKIVGLFGECPTDIDDCGVCGGDNSSCLGCDGIANSMVGFDCDGICGGDNFNCSLEVNNLVPENISLINAYPNPFNPSLIIEFTNSELDLTNIYIYNIKGEIVEVLVENELIKGNKKINWNSKNLPSGIYLIKLATSQYNTTQKVLLLK